MKQIILPLFNLELKINPVAFRILGIPITYYAILIIASFILAIILSKRKSGQFGIKYQDILDLSIILIPVAIICARIYYVIFNLKNYTSFIDMLNIKDGGLAIYGGIIGGVITVILFCKKRKIITIDLLDFLAPLLALGQSIGRWGNFINVEAYGETTNLPWKMGIVENGNIKYVHPTFLYESISTFIIFLLLNKLSKKRKFKGEITYTYLIFYGAIRFIIESFRTDSLMLGNFKISKILSIILCILGIIGVIYNLYKTTSKQQ